jgi:hypothetical protein
MRTRYAEFTCNAMMAPSGRRRRRAGRTERKIRGNPEHEHRSGAPSRRVGGDEVSGRVGGCRTAEVFRWGAHDVVKLFSRPCRD